MKELVNSQVSRLSVVVPPGSEHFVTLALAGAPVRLDLDSPNLLVMNGQVSGLGVIVSPGSEVVVSLAGAAVHLDLDTSHWRSSVGSVSSSGEIIPVVCSRWPGTVWPELDLPRHSVNRLLLQQEHWVGGGCSGQAEDGESDLHVL